jgi:hypothetical protein
MTDTPPVQDTPGAHDAELRVVETIMLVMQHVPTYRWLPVLDYLRDRARSEAPHEPLESNFLTHAIHEDIARVIAESDGHDWDAMDAVSQSPYFRRAGALANWACEQSGNP